MHFDWQTLAIGISSFVGGIGAVVAFFGKYLPVTKKYIGIAEDSLSVVERVLDSVQEDKDAQGKPTGKITITQEELNLIQAAAIKLRDDFKK